MASSSMTDFDLGWVCGIIEGEGAITAIAYERSRTRNGKIYTCRDKTILLRVTQVDRSILDRIHSLTGVGQVKKKKVYSLLSQQPQFEWRVHKRKELKALLSLILPHLSQRRQIQVKKALDLLGPLV